MSTFGDIEPDDVYAADGEPDPDQVAYRLHELRRYVDQLAGQDPGAWEDLEPQEQTLALAIGGVIVDWLVTTDPDQPDLTARQLHTVRRYWSGNAMPAWEDLSEDERAVATALMAQLLDWLKREGSL